MADRLFDVAGRSLDQLHSVRHRFAKHYSNTLWKLCICVLVVNVSLAFAGLTIPQLCKGTLLLFVCLLYTLLNQTLSGRFFPKELCVALIYTAGVVVFLQPIPSLLPEVGTPGLLCTINCMMISAKEQPIDTAMQIYSIAHYLPKLSYALYAGCLILLMFSQQLHLPLLLSLAALLGVHFADRRLSIESFRVLADGALLVGPLITLLIEIS